MINYIHTHSKKEPSISYSNNLIALNLIDLKFIICFYLFFTWNDITIWKQPTFANLISSERFLYIPRI